jgi:hypothetical protein
VLAAWPLPRRAPWVERVPEPDCLGNYPAVPSARASLARKIIRRWKTAGLTQADLARRAGIRPPTLNRPENEKSTPDAANREQDHSRAEATSRP